MPAFFDQATMPRRTYGGRAAGGPTMMDHAMNMLGSQGMNAAAMGNQYAPMHQSPLAMAPTTAGGYLGQMANQNPGGRFFGGALPAYGTSSGGNTRPMFMGQFGNPQGVGQQQAANYWQQNARYFDPRTGTASQEHLGGYSPSDIRGMQLSGMGPNYKAPANLAQTQQAYQARTAGNMAGRQANVFAQAQARGQGRADSLRMQRGQLSMPEQMAFGIPGYANQQLQNQNSMGWMGLQGQMFQQKQMADAHNGYMDRMAQLAGAIPQMGLPPGLQQQYMQHIMGQMGMPGGPAGQNAPMATRGQPRADFYLTPQQQGEFRNLPPAQREKWLNDHGITDTATRQYMLGTHITPGRSWWDTIGDGIAQIPGFGSAPSRPTQRRSPNGRGTVPAATQPSPSGPPANNSMGVPSWMWPF